MCVREYRGRQSQQHTSVIPALRRVRPEDGKLKARLDYKVRRCLKHKQRVLWGTGHPPGFCTLLVFSAMAHSPPPSFLWRCGHQPCDSSKGQPDRESLCPHRKALCVPLPTTASDKATLGESLPGNKHSWESVAWPGAVPRWGASASCCSPLQKHNLKDRFHVAL